MANLPGMMPIFLTEPRWRPIESAPVADETVLVWLPKPLRDDDPNIRLARRFPMGWYDATTGEWGDWFRPTHWMPVPEAPR